MKKIIRSFLSGLCFSIFGIGGIITGLGIVPLVLIIFPKKQQRQIFSSMIHYLWKVFVWGMCIMKLIDVKIKDKDQLKQLRGNIIVANHPSLIDVVILVSKIPRSICVVKGSLFKNFFVKSLIRRVYLSNSMPPQDFMDQAIKDLNMGYNIIIFPEGTRTIKNRPLHLHRGFAYLQIYSGHDIQPIHIKNKPHILGKNSSWYDVGVKTSVYSLKILPKIVFNQKIKQNNRQQAIAITEITKKSLFQAQNA